MSRSAPSKESKGSTPTDRWVPCPYATSFHPEILSASQVERGPKRFHTTCPLCGTRSVLVPKFLSTKNPGASIGYTREECAQHGWKCV